MRDLARHQPRCRIARRVLAEGSRAWWAYAGRVRSEVLVVTNRPTDDWRGGEPESQLRPLPSARSSDPDQERRDSGRTGDLAFLDERSLVPSSGPDLALASRPDLDGCFGQVLPTDGEGRPLGDLYPASLPANGDVFEALLCRWPQIGALVIRASVRETVGYLDESLLTAEDWDWLLRLSLRHRIGHAAVPALMFRARPVATAYEDETHLRRVGVDRRVFWRYVWRGRRRILSPVRVLRAALRYDGVYAGYFVRSGAAHASAGDCIAARRSLGLAVRISPLHVAASIIRRPSSLRWIAWTLFGRPAHEANPQ